jgi:hypothetical protein
MHYGAYAKRLTISQAQQNQPWTVPYSEGVDRAAHGTPDRYSGSEGMILRPGAPGIVPHILGSHCVLHAVKSLGKIAAVYEARDHDHGGVMVFQPGLVSSFEGREVERRAEIRKMAADLMTAALRFANLEGFDLAEALVERVQQKNGADFGCLPECPPECPQCSGGGCL